jgi:prepilin-type N-terminal cleavage/methylation domain-containing protein
MTTIHPSVSRRSRGGFTLLELVVVIGILAILTGLLLPKFDVFKLKANKAVAASNMTDINRIIQTYYAQNSVYPDKWDSLLLPAGTLWRAADTDAKGLEWQLTGGPAAGASGADPEKLIPLTGGLDEGETRSLLRIGITTVLDLDAAASDAAPNEQFTTNGLRALAVGGAVATLNPADEDAAAIIRHIYPNDQPNPADPLPAPALPSGKRLVVLGFGSHNTSIGNLVTEVPFYPNTDVTKYYSRFLAVFEVGGGSRAELKAVIGADGDPIFDEMGDFFER